ncbi:hypothetical protein LXL04_027135 [Taraxacum kok-saghyz]
MVVEFIQLQNVRPVTTFPSRDRLNIPTPVNKNAAFSAAWGCRPALTLAPFAAAFPTYRWLRQRLPKM